MNAEKVLELIVQQPTLGLCNEEWDQLIALYARALAAVAQDITTQDLSMMIVLGSVFYHKALDEYQAGQQATALYEQCNPTKQKKSR
jgi:hypothetical protein